MVVGVEGDGRKLRGSSKRPIANAAPPKSLVPASSSVQQAKKRAALSNLASQCNIRANSKSGKASQAKKLQGPGETAISKGKLTCNSNRRSVSNEHVTGIVNATVKPPPLQVSESQVHGSQVHGSCTLPTNNKSSTDNVSRPSSADISSPPRSGGESESMYESMSTSDSSNGSAMASADESDSSAIASLERKTLQNLYITKHPEINGDYSQASSVSKANETADIIDLDTDDMDPQMCTIYANDIDQHLRIAEAKSRASSNYMETVQEDINSSMRGILIDWLVEVGEEYKLTPDTLYLTVCYIDRYLSKNVVNRQRLQLLGVTCMLIASKYEEICAPQVEEFCYITDNTYFREEVIQMETKVLQQLNFELSTPTTKSFLRRFIRAAQVSHENVPCLQLEFLANYLAELSLPEYNLIGHLPSVVAASAVFLAKFTLDPSKKPWNPTLKHYTNYKASELKSCVESLHGLQLNKEGCGLPAIREKYKQHKFKCVSTLTPPPVIPLDYFSDF